MLFKMHGLWVELHRCVHEVWLHLLSGISWKRQNLQMNLPLFWFAFLFLVPFHSASVAAMWSALLVMVGTANVQISLKVEGPMFYFCLFFLMSQLDVIGWFICFLTFSFAESRYCLCQTEGWAVWSVAEELRCGISAAAATVSLAPGPGCSHPFPWQKRWSHSVSQINHSIFISETTEPVSLILCVCEHSSVFYLSANNLKTLRKCHQQNLNKYFWNWIQYKIDVCKNTRWTTRNTVTLLKKEV